MTRNRSYDLNALQCKVAFLCEDKHKFQSHFLILFYINEIYNVIFSGK